MEIPIGVIQIARDIESMKIRGAGKIARAVAEAMIVAGLEYNGPRDINDFKRYVARVAKLLISTRPSAVSLPNAVIYVMAQLRNKSSYEEAKESLISAAKNFIKNSEDAVKKISEFGAKRIKDGSVVLTHCHSSAAVEVIINGYKQGRVVKVYSTETRPFLQGRLTASHLIKYGVPTVQIPDSATRYIMHEVDYVVVGADTVTSNGAIVNKIGTSQVALAAKEARTRVYVATESYKFSPMTLIGELVKIEYRNPEEIVAREWLNKHPQVKVLNPVFDVTPPEYVDAIITEFGVLPPQASALISIDKLGWTLETIKYSEDIVSNLEKIIG
ncbi:MAG: ribose 1,5-bisphosphate isomerase [Desulfurococcaceae archaeon]